MTAVGLRRASPDDRGYLTELAQDSSVAPFLAPVRLILERLDALLRESASDGGPDGMFVIETDAGQPLGGLAIHLFSRNSRICELSTLMVDPVAQRLLAGRSMA